jgi:hypothetical protein
VPICLTGGFKTSHWPIHSIGNPGFIYIIGANCTPRERRKHWHMNQKPGFHPTISCAWITWRMKKVTTGMMETGYAVTMLEMPTDNSFVQRTNVGTVYYARNGSGNASMCKYWYNNHHIEVTCGPPTTTRENKLFFSGCRLNQLWLTSQGGESALDELDTHSNIEGLILIFTSMKGIFYFIGRFCGPHTSIPSPTGIVLFFYYILNACKFRCGYIK